MNRARGTVESPGELAEGRHEQPCPRSTAAGRAASLRAPARADRRGTALGLLLAETSFVVSPGWGRVDTHLTAFARHAGADLLVVGTHRRAGLARLWRGSVSRGVLHYATTNVACVPRG